MASFQQPNLSLGLMGEADYTTRESFWDARVGAVGSWIWKKLLQLRQFAKQFLCMEVRNGKTVGFLTDIWLPIRRLIEVIGERELRSWA